MSSSMLRPRNLAIVGGAIGGAYYTFTTFNVFETPATKAIGDRYSAGGGTPTHLPATATKLGDPDHVVPAHTHGKNSAGGGM